MGNAEVIRTGHTCSTEHNPALATRRLLEWGRGGDVRTDLAVRIFDLAAQGSLGVSAWDYLL